MEVEWYKPVTFDKISIDELGNNITDYKILFFENNQWNTNVTGTSCGSNQIHHFDVITTSKCRIAISNAKLYPMISEFKIFNK